ncbi:MAG: DUF6268 family outer membrane beta-barrel protein [Myxococcota bacterium]
MDGRHARLCFGPLLATTLLLFAAPPAVKAQSGNAIGVTLEYLPDSTLQSERGTDDPQEFGYGNIRANLVAPVEIERWNMLLLPGASYRLYRPRVDGRIDQDGVTTLHDLDLRFGVLKRFGDWSALFNAGFGLATDFRDLEADHLRYQGLGVVRYEGSDSWILGLGGAFTYWFGEPQLLPVAQVIYRGDRWNADLTLPRVANVRYLVLDGFEVGGLAQVDGNRFSIGQDLAFESVSLSIADAGLVAGVKLTGPIWLTVYGGATLLRRYDLLDEDNVELLNLDQSPGPIFRLGLVLRPE